MESDKIKKKAITIILPPAFKLSWSTSYFRTYRQNLSKFVTSTLAHNQPSSVTQHQKQVSLETSTCPPYNNNNNNNNK